MRGGGGASGGSSTLFGKIDAIFAYAHKRPMLHFVLSEFFGGMASFSVLAFFVLFSYLADLIIKNFPLVNGAPAQFLEEVLAWGAAFSGGITFIVITVCSLVRLALDQLRPIRP